MEEINFLAMNMLVELNRVELQKVTYIIVTKLSTKTSFV